MIVDIGGGLHSFGSPEYGQLGHNTDGKLLEKAGKISFDCENTPRLITKFVEKNKGTTTPIGPVKVLDVRCGVNHSVAVDSEGRLFTWGFGGYGRLGHAEAKDEFLPRQVKQLENLRFKGTKIGAGSSYCIAYSENNKMLYFWGQTKSSGEATMYPKPIQDICGWNIRSIGCCNRSIVLAADDSVISWGASPTFGELGYGENRPKSSTVPQEVKPLEGMHIKEVACGFAHTLFIARDVSAEDRLKLTKFPKWP
jgi:alpha-tubulin suppressor-like RCC1 family protein